MRGTEHPDATTARHDGRGRRPLRGPAAAGMLMALALIAVACGGSAKTAAVASTTTTTAATRAAQTQAFIQCMQRHGVPITSTRGLGGQGAFGGAGAAGDTGTTRSVPATTLPPGVTQSQYNAALQACRGLLPIRGANPQNSAAALAYRNCVNLQLQQAGVTTLPPIGQGGGGGGGFGQPGASTTTPSPAVQAARAHCANLLPAGGFGRGGSTTTTPTT